MRGNHKRLIIDTSFLLDYVKHRYRLHQPVAEACNEVNLISSAGIVLNSVRERFLNELGAMIAGSWVQPQLVWKIALDQGGMDLQPHFLKTRYRQHHMHQFLCAGLCIWALDHCKIRGIPLRESLERRLRHDYRYKLRWWTLDHIWWLICLLHDHAGPLSILLENRDLIAHMGAHYGIPLGRDPNLKVFLDRYHSSNVFAQNLLSLLREILEKRERVLNQLAKEAKRGSKWQVIWKEAKKTVLEYDKDAAFRIRNLLTSYQNVPADWFSWIEKHVSNAGHYENAFDHGLLAVLNLLLRHTEQFPTTEIVHDPVASSILTPIALHNIYSVPDDNGSHRDLQVDFLDAPDVFLLKLIDHLQEWGRAIREKSELHIESDRIEISPVVRMGRGKYDHYVDIENMTVTYVFDNSHDALSKTGWKIGEFKKDKQKKLKTLRIDGKALDIRIQVQVGLMADFGLAD